MSKTVTFAIGDKLKCKSPLYTFWEVGRFYKIVNITGKGKKTKLWISTDLNNFNLDTTPHSVESYFDKVKQRNLPDWW